MAKKSSTVHLESSTWDEIDKYKEEYGCSSRNEAIERMFTERRLLLKINCGSEEFKKAKIEIKEDNKLSGAINSTYYDMPD